MIEYRFRVPSAAVFTLHSYSKALEYPFRVPTAGSLRGPLWNRGGRPCKPRYKEWRSQFILVVDSRGAVRRIEATAGRLAGFCLIVTVDKGESDFRVRLAHRISSNSFKN
jgi:hypothetical protein